MMNTHLNISHLLQLYGFHEQMIYHHYNFIMTYHHHQNHLVHLLTLHHLFIQVLKDTSLRQDTKVLFQININTKDKESSQNRLQKWRDK